MSYFLYHSGEDRDVHVVGLSYYLDLAVVSGWEPMGTVDPFDNPEVGLWDSETCGEWSGAYAVNCCQTVREDDARAFSAALFQALDMIERKQLTPEQSKVLERVCREHNNEDWSLVKGWFLAKVREIAEFAAEGAFQIC